MREREYPLPPIEKMRHGSVWKVLLEPARRRKPFASWNDAWSGLPIHREHIMMVGRIGAAGETPVPRRTRAVVGDVSRRELEAILRDLAAILRQDPPCPRNWRQNLSRVVLGGIHYHLFWAEEITLLT